jgi:hypothetical protein
MPAPGPHFIGFADNILRDKWPRGAQARRVGLVEEHQCSIAPAPQFGRKQPLPSKESNPIHCPQKRAKIIRDCGDDLPRAYPDEVGRNPIDFTEGNGGNEGRDRKES